MAVRRIVSNIRTDDPAGVASFYRQVFGLDTAMDMGWIVTLVGADQPVQISAMKIQVNERARMIAFQYLKEFCT